VIRSRPARLRPLHAERVVKDGRDLVLVRDPLGVAARRDGAHALGLFVPSEIWSIAELFDGVRSCDEIAARCPARAEKPYSAADVREIARGFSHRFLLRDERAETEISVQHAFFKSSPERPCVGAGRDYTADPIDLRIEIAGLVANDWDMPATNGIFGAITPASGFLRAGKLYSRTYAAMRHVGCSFARALVLGQMHEEIDELLVPLEKPFATPFGALACDIDGVRALDASSGSHELAHRGALVLERQCLFLKLLFPRLPIVPVLVAAVAQPNDEPAADVESAVEALERVLALPGETLVVCAADLSSVGGHAGAPSDLRERDRIMVDHATRADARSFWSAAVADETRRPLALLAPYLLLRACAGRASSDSERATIAGSVLGYQQFVEAERVTSAASVLFH